MIEAIENRRSIRRYFNVDIPEDIILKIVEAGVKAPSAKNRQPWKFIIVKGESKKGMLEAFKKGLEQEKCGNGILQNSKQHLAGAEYTIEILRQAPVTIFVLNSEGRDLFQILTPEEKIYEIANIESISAAIQNMILTATDIGIGSLWVCDVFFAYKELNEWLNTDGEMIAALALGYPIESPNARSRKKLSNILIWRK